MEDLVELRTQKYNMIDMNSLDVLIDILLNSPEEKELEQISSEDFEFELVEMITNIGRRDVTYLLKKIKELLYIEQARPIIIDVLGGLNCEDSILLLEHLLIENLNENEAIRLANAVKEIGGIKAKEMLEKIKEKYSKISQVVLKEVDIRLSTLNGV